MVFHSKQEVEIRSKKGHVVGYILLVQGFDRWANRGSLLFDIGLGRGFLFLFESFVSCFGVLDCCCFSVFDTLKGKVLSIWFKPFLWFLFERAFLFVEDGCMH